MRIADAAPFVEAAADAMGIDRLRVIDTGLDPVTAEREQWDDGNNTLALAPGVVVAYERNIETNARLEDSGIEVLPIAASELGTGRGGPRCMSCPGGPRPAVVRGRGAGLSASWAARSPCSTSHCEIGMPVSIGIQPREVRDHQRDVEADDEQPERSSFGVLPGLIQDVAAGSARSP